MIPEVDVLLRGLVAKLMTEVAPALADRYVRSNVEMMAAMLAAAAEEFDRAAEVRVAENRALRALFADAAREPGAAALADRLAAEAAAADASLRIGDLNATNARLRALLVELHALVEGRRGEAWAERLERAIWGELEASAQRRAISFFPL